MLLSETIPLFVSQLGGRKSLRPRCASTLADCLVVYQQAVFALKSLYLLEGEIVWRFVAWMVARCKLQPTIACITPDGIRGFSPALRHLVNGQ